MAKRIILIIIINSLFPPKLNLSVTALNWRKSKAQEYIVPEIIPIIISQSFVRANHINS